MNRKASDATLHYDSGDFGFDLDALLHPAKPSLTLRRS